MALHAFGHKTEVNGYKANLSPLDNLLANQKETYEHVYKNPRNAQTYDTPRFHYDWWLFPLEAGANWSATAIYYSVNADKTAALLKNASFKQIYVDSVKMYLDAQTRRWNKYNVRFGKVFLSLAHFIKATKDLPEYKDFHQQLIAQAARGLEIAKQNKLDLGDDILAKAIKQMPALMKSLNLKEASPEAKPAPAQPVAIAQAKPAPVKPAPVVAQARVHPQQPSPTQVKVSAQAPVQARALPATPQAQAVLHLRAAIMRQQGQLQSAQRAANPVQGRVSVQAKRGPYR